MLGRHENTMVIVDLDLCPSLCLIFIWSLFCKHIRDTYESVTPNTRFAASMSMLWKCHICYENADKNLETNDKQCWGIYLVSTSFTVVSLLFEAFRYDEFSFLKLHEFSVFEEFLLCLFGVQLFQKRPASALYNSPKLPRTLSELPSLQKLRKYFEPFLES